MKSILPPCGPDLLSKSMRRLLWTLMFMMAVSVIYFFLTYYETTNLTPVE